MSERGEHDVECTGGSEALRRGDSDGLWVRGAACSGRSAMFDDPARMNEALRLCARCPVLVECRTWALTTAVHGVAGGMAAGAREAWRAKQGLPEPVVSIAEFLPLAVSAADQRYRLGRSDVILRAVAERTANGDSAREIADDLGVTRRTVNRLRATCRTRGISNGESALAG